jgi:ParB family chromosome partitioning protein
MADLQATWLARLPEDAADLWDWCLKQDQQLLLDLLAFIAALSVNAVETRHERRGSPRQHHAGQLATALPFNMTTWWRPSPKWFGQRVSKAILVDALTEVGQAGLAIRVRAAKKLEAARLAVPALAQAGWLPAPLRDQLAGPAEPARADGDPEV